MAQDRRYLIKHGNQWIVRVKVPLAIRPIVGKAHLKAPLHTDSLVIANRQKHEHIHRMKAELHAAESQRRRKAGLEADPLTEEALRWNSELKQSSKQSRPAGITGDGEIWAISEADETAEAIIDRAYEIEAREGAARAKNFHDIATGKATPLASMIDAWLASRAMKPRQIIDYRRAVLKFADWLTANHQAVTVEVPTRRMAGEYIRQAFVEPKANARTANKDISCLSSYWKWLRRSGYADENIWSEQSLPKPQKPKDKLKRAYTDEEISVLLGGSPPAYLMDMMHIAALSGMRIEEIARLTVETCSEGRFDIRVAKTRAGERLIPIHSSLAPIIARRSEGKAADAPLFPELPIPPEGSAVERSQKAVKAFTNYRRARGIDEVPPGERQSRIDFHSFRRWFATKAERADQAPHLISALCGHGRPGMTLGVYSDGPSWEQYRRIVESVRLPNAPDQPDASAATSSGTSP